MPAGVGVLVFDIVLRGICVESKKLVFLLQKS